MNFKVKFHTVPGQDLFITGAHPLLGANDVNKAVPMQFFNEGCWTAQLEWPAGSDETVYYNYLLKHADGSIVIDWGKDKYFSLKGNTATEIVLIDTWNHAGYYENTFYAEAFQEVLLKNNFTPVRTAKTKSYTHQLRVRSPLLAKGQTICIAGSAPELNNWSVIDPVLLSREEGSEHYTVQLDLSKATFPVSYKYGVYDIEKKQFVTYENGNNRILYVAGGATIVNDGFAYLPSNTWRGAGIAVPVFSLRSHEGFGVGEFSDLKALANWAANAGLKMIQILPVNDTTATHTWKDSYPYAAISAFALHPIYMNLFAIAGEQHHKQVKKLEAERARLNALPVVDYDEVIRIKLQFIKDVYKDLGKETLASAGFKSFFQQNEHWLKPYAVFCYLRDEYGTVNFSKWPAYNQYNSQETTAFLDGKSPAGLDIAFHYYVQYHLHLQLKDATAYARSKGIIVKGDIAIGVYRYGADTWQHPDLFHMNFQAGAPPDDFAVKGQNWGFPTYNWQKMQQDGFAWWKQRFEQMKHYFDAFRIDHILGFFRIWSIPMDAVEGIMGHFVPALPVHVNEFNQQGTWFDYDRYTKPFITDGVLWEVFGYDNELVKSMFLDHANIGSYTLKPQFATQRLVEAHFAGLEDDAHHQKIRQGLYDLISNVLLFDADGKGQSFHFRFGMEGTSSFRYLEWNTQQQLKAAYVDYFYRRQDDFWKKEALQKLPALKRVTSMVVCGEDLGMVPSCVPDVMKQLGLLSLEIQRMPKDPKKEFFHPNDAPYLSVVTPSTHDMSTIRGWWEEDKVKVQRFYNNELGQWGEAPYYCEAWINKAIVVQHLHSPAMWSIFQLQDLVGMDEQLRRKDPQEEQINVPANPNHYWRYRMQLDLEELQKANDFNEELAGLIVASGR
ncbi:MAG: 4-alpha-glucanotransferase [Sphingobacteriia bacterium]|nr:4-alpha-glucanotransferase [Sphingobacteriia bacterium]